MARRGIVHPRLMQHLTTYWYPDTVTITQVAGIRDDAGQITTTTTTIVDAIRCRISPKAANERRGQQYTAIVGSHQIALNGHYPQITATMHAVVDGVGTYQILGVIQDGEGVSTYLDVEVVS